MGKNLISVLFAITLSSMALHAQDSEVNHQPSKFQKSVRILIKGMACQEGCADAINNNLKKISGVRSSTVNFETREANINFDSNEVSIDSLKIVIANTKVKEYVYTIEEVILKEEN